jgi:hypothetical protein
MNSVWERWSLSAAELWRRLRRPSNEQRLRASQLDGLVEQVVDAYNPRLRAVSGYLKKLRPVVEPATTYFADLLRQIPGPVRMDPNGWSSDPVLNALFGSADRMRQLASQDREVRRFFRDHADADHCYALLTAMPSVRNVLGSELVGDSIQRDVRQTTVSFSDHKLDFPSMDQAETSAQLERFALQALAGRALEQVSEQESRIAELEERQRIVRIKQKVADVESRGFDGMVLGSDEPLVEVEAARSRLAELAEQLAEARQGLTDLDDHLEHLKAVFERPREFLTLEPISVRLDRMNVVREGKAAEAGRDIVFTRGRRGDRPGRVFLFVSIPRADLIPGEQLLREVERYTG